jgi:glycosyltransferase involved in cell wall biosynthesis
MDLPLPSDDADQAVHRAHPSAARLTIAHVTNYQVPGYGYDEIQLSREQTRMGHEVAIITSNYLHPAGPYSVLSQRFPSRHVAPRQESVDGVSIMRLPSREFARRVWISGLERSLRELNPDVIHCHNLLQFHPARVALSRARGQHRGAIVVDDHMHIGFMRRSVAGRLFYAAYRTLGQPVIGRRVDRFSAIADDTRDYLRTECGVKQRIDVVPLGVDVKAFAPDPQMRESTRSRLQLTPSTLVLLYTGKVIQEKGVHLLVEAAAQLGAEGTDVSVLVVGDADDVYKRSLESLAFGREAHLELRVCPSVDQDHLPEWYSAADVGVWPRQESMGVFQAMAAGLPVVVSANSGLAPMVVPGRGLTYWPEDAATLAAHVRGLVNQEVRVRLGEAGRRFAETKLSWEQSAARYVAIYREAIAARNSS